jgi:hypothetical protein
MLHSKDLEVGSWGNVATKKRHYMIFFHLTLTLHMKDYHFMNVLESCIVYWFILQQDIQNLSNYFLLTIFALLS